MKDAFQWDDSQQLSQKKAMIEKMQKSPDRWATEQRDKYRYFVDSPEKGEASGDTRMNY